MVRIVIRSLITVNVNFLKHRFKFSKFDMFSVCDDFAARISPADKKPAAFKRHRNERSHRNGRKLRNWTKTTEKGEKRS